MLIVVDSENSSHYLQNNYDWSTSNYYTYLNYISSFILYIVDLVHAEHDPLEYISDLNYYLGPGPYLNITFQRNRDSIYFCENLHTNFGQLEFSCSLVVRADSSFTVEFGLSIKLLNNRKLPIAVGEITFSCLPLERSLLTGWLHVSKIQQVIDDRLATEIQLDDINQYRRYTFQ